MNDRQQLLELHEQLLQAHRRGDIDLWLSAEAEAYIVANRGEVSYPSKAARAARLGPYLQQTRFSEYADLIEPIVRISRDGSLGWVIVQIRARGIQQTEDGKEAPLEFISAWIELYEKQDGHWLRIGNVSNFKD